MEHTAKKIEHKYHMQGPGTSDKVDLDSAVKKPKFNELEYLEKLEKAQNGQFKIPLAKEKASELETAKEFNEMAFMRTFYWAAYYGKVNFVVGYMVLQLKWSPFIKSFQKQSVLTAAIRGKQVNLVRKIANFLFVADAAKKSTVKIFEDWVVDNWYGKDLDDNNPLHYAYLSDLPDIRQILRQSKLDGGEMARIAEGGKAHHPHEPPGSRMNRRSQVPSQMRHEQKCEPSSDSSDQDADGVSSADEEPEEDALGMTQQERDLFGTRKRVDYTVDNPQYVLSTTKRLSKKQKLAFYNDPDYCFIVQKEYMSTMREALEPLMKSGGIYYSTYDRDGMADQTIVVIYVDDTLLDVMAELIKVKCRLSNYKCMLEFKCYAADLFEQFDN